MMNISQTNNKQIFTVDIKTFEDKYGNKFEVNEERIKEVILHEISNQEYDLKQSCTESQIINDFDSFKVDKKMLTCEYDETNAVTYPHFVYHYLRKWYTTAEGSSHWTNGGKFEHSCYDPITLRHKRMLEDDFIVGLEIDSSVRDRILTHFLTGEGVRMYGLGQNNKTVDIGTHARLIEFLKFILDSKMFKVNDKISLSDTLLNKDTYRTKPVESAEDYRSIAELLILQCWRTNHDLDALKMLVDDYGLDLYKAEKHVKKDDVSMLVRIIDQIYNNQAHEYYKADKESWQYKSVHNSVKFFAYIIRTFPELKCVDRTLWCRDEWYKNGTHDIELHHHKDLFAYIATTKFVSKKFKSILKTEINKLAK